jgi:hypothetical protein
VHLDGGKQHRRRREECREVQDVIALVVGSRQSAFAVRALDGVVNATSCCIVPIVLFTAFQTQLFLTRSNAPMSNINLDNIKDAFDHLADKEAGRSALLTFRKQMDELIGKVPTKLNEDERLYVLKALVNSMRPPHQQVIDGELNEAQLGAVAGGVSTMTFNTNVIRLGDQTRLIGNLGFQILAQP